MLFGSDGMEYDPLKLAWLPPVSPTKMVGLVLNYADHADELGLSTSEDPVLLLKPLNTLLGHMGNIVYPKEATFMHYEAELAVVIGRQARRVKKERALDFIKGYTIANDVTVRDFITNTFRPPVRAKGFDTFCPLGPYLVTPDEIPDVNNLNIKTLVNGVVKQEGNTKSLIHSIPKLLEFITSFMTLEPDDTILTGTPKGISPIVPGDRVQISIDGIGTLENTVVSESTAFGSGK
jgi:5-oxopent-3-ene-1,2,5-tricarboxylate decarboxylase / 2-hydroxyhepta-2,4-diene-1,7-dioate isomerase